MRALCKVLMVATLMLACACTPRFNWREMPAAGGAVRVSFPSRPKPDKREVDVAGHPLVLSFDMAPVDKSIFAVGYADLPDGVMADPAEVARVADAFEGVLRANLRGTLERRQEVGLKQGAADARPVSRAVELEVRGTVAGAPSWLLGRVYVVGNRVIEVVAVGRESELPREAAETFVQSVRAD